MTKDEIVKDEIVAQAQGLFQQFGLKKTTMDEIAEACGKAKSTLYHYFNSKEEVFDAVIVRELTALRVIVKDAVENRKGLKEKLIIYFIIFHQEILHKLNIYRVVKHELKNDNQSREYFLKLMSFERSYITRLLEDGFDAGEFTEIDREDIPWFSETLLAAFFGIVRYSIETEKQFDPDKLEKITRILIPKVFA